MRVSRQFFSVFLRGMHPCRFTRSLKSRPLIVREQPLWATLGTLRDVALWMLCFLSLSLSSTSNLLMEWTLPVVFHCFGGEDRSLGFGLLPLIIFGYFTSVFEGACPYNLDKSLPASVSLLNTLHFAFSSILHQLCLEAGCKKLGTHHWATIKERPVSMMIYWFKAIPQNPRSPYLSLGRLARCR